MGTKEHAQQTYWATLGKEAPCLVLHTLAQCPLTAQPTPLPCPDLGDSIQVATMPEQTASNGVLAVGDEAEGEAARPAHHLLPTAEVAVFRNLCKCSGRCELSVRCIWPLFDCISMHHSEPRASQD